VPIRAALFSYFELEDLIRLLDAISGSGMPAGVRVHIGTYGVNREASITVHTYGPGRYSPMFKAEVRTAAWEERTLTPDEERQVSRRFAGRVPDEPALLGLSASQRTAWGVEVGRRYRDTIRHARAAGITVDSWQLDELGTQLAGPQGRQHREFVRGVLQGMTFGRPVLGDSEGKGVVWSTRSGSSSTGRRSALSARSSRTSPATRLAQRERRRTAGARSRPAAPSGALSPAGTLRA